MGRKPNLVISKHFKRGAKIGDASNRYQFTCKHCGERFPKGRIESLYNHVTKSCTALPSQEKSALVLQIHELGLAANAAAPAANKAKLGDRTNAGDHVLPPDQQNFDALNVLAEASRQVVATQYSYPPTVTTGNDIGVTSRVLDPALENEGFSCSSFGGVDDGDPALENEITSAGGTSIAAISSAHSLPQHPSETSTTIASNVSVPLQHATFGKEAASLSSIAASANATLAHSMIPKPPDYIHRKGNLLTVLPVAASTATQNVPSWRRVVPAVNETCDDVQDDKLLEQQMAAAFPRPIAMNPHTRADDIPPVPLQEPLTQKVKARANFNDDRKKEIKKMREIGSCIRCRMLRKSCSVTTPCVTCGAIDSPRAWKGLPCLRAKLVDLYQGYMLGLNRVLCLHKIEAIKSEMRFVSGPGKLLVRYFEDAEPIVLSILEGDTDNAAIDPSLLGLSSVQVPVKTIILDDEANDLPTILEEYVQKGAAHFFKEEASPIIRSVAMLVHKYSRESGDGLARNVVDLWMLTTMLAERTTCWKISAFQNLPQGSSAYCHGQAAVGLPIDVHTDQQSHTLICSQLQDGLERLASKLITHAMNKFEKCMFRPASLNQFQTFLVAILLINCVERHSWIFHTWTDESRAARWPFEESPAALVSQADQVTKLIAFMIKVRNLTSTTTEDTASGILKAEQPNDEKYAGLFEEVGVTVDFLTQRQDAVFNPDDYRSLDLKYSAVLLLPSPNPGGT